MFRLFFDTFVPNSGKMASGSKKRHLKVVDDDEENNSVEEIQAQQNVEGKDEEGKKESDIGPLPTSSASDEKPKKKQKSMNFCFKFDFSFENFVYF